MNEWTKEWILFISSSFPLMMSCLSVQGRLCSLEHSHFCSCKTSVNSRLISQGALRPLWQIKEKSSNSKSSLIWAPACCLSTGRRWQEVLKSPESHALRYLAPPPLRDLDVEAVSRSRNDPGWRRAMTAAGLVAWRQFAVGSGLQTTGTSRTSRTSCPHFCKRQM